MNTMLSALVIGGNSGLVSLLITVVVAALVFWLIWWIVGWMKLPSPVDMIIRVVVGLIAIVFLLHLLGVY